MEPLASNKRRRPASASLSPPPPPRQPARDDENRRKKKRRLDVVSGSDADAAKRPELRSPEPEPEPKKPTPTGKRRRSASPDADAETSHSSSGEDKRDVKRRRGEDGSATSPPPELPTSPPANLSERHSQTETEEPENRPQEEEKQEEKARFPPSPLVIPPQEETFKENMAQGATYTNLEDFVVSSQGSDADLVAACNNLDNDVVSCSQDSQSSEAERVRQRTSLRSVQVTPPPSARMLDRKNPPPPPKRPKRRCFGAGIVYARTYPRLALSPLVDDSPPGSPRVFRSLENEFAFAMQDTPETRPRVRPAPRMARGTRRSTRAGSSRARRSLDTPTSTMVLRSRQLNPSLSADGSKPENQREREQRDAQDRQ